MPTTFNLHHYEANVLKIARFYFYLYVQGVQSTDVDLSDLEQAGRIAVFNIATKRPEKLNSPAYVSAAIKYSCIGEIKKMRHKGRQVYLSHQHDEEVPIIDLLPTREYSPDKLDQLDDLLYQVRQEFSSVEADALDALVQKCADVYDLNLSAPPSTDTKDRVKVVTAMDLEDDEMVLYAQILTGAIKKFPQFSMMRERGGTKKIKKYFAALLQALKMDPTDFARYNHKAEFFKQFRLHSPIMSCYDLSIGDFLLDFDSNVQERDLFKRVRWGTKIRADEIKEIIFSLARTLAKRPQELEHVDFVNAGLEGMLDGIFKRHRMAVEFACPGTFPKYQERALEIWEKYK